MAKSTVITRKDVQNILAHVNLGDDVHHELTQAEFDALSDDVKNDGTVYFITDVGSGGSIFMDDNVPIGTIALYGGTVDPSYWLVCDGRALNRITYSELFAVVGTTYGGNGTAGTFNVPNLTSETGSKYIIKAKSTISAHQADIDFFYPIGSFYETTDIYFNPNIQWGGTWEKIETGRILQATQVNSEVGTRVAAGLPNITGQWSTGWNQPVRGFHNLTASGAFYVDTDTSKPGRITAEDANGGSSRYPGFDASGSNPIYGNSDTVQPPALLVVMWHRIA
jgi:hypothetical protein